MRFRWYALFLLAFAGLLTSADGALAQSREEREVRAVLDRGVAAANSVMNAGAIIDQGAPRKRRFLAVQN